MAFLSAATVPYAFRVGLGGWAKPYRAVSSFMQAVLATIGQYDATRETQRYAVRLMLAIMFMHPSRDANGAQPVWRVVSFVAFDLLWHDSADLKDLTQRQLEQRRKLLRAIVTETCASLSPACTDGPRC